MLELLAYLALYLLDFATLFRVDNGNRHSGLSCTTGTAATVGIGGSVVGQAVVDHVSEVVHVESACSHIGSHKNLEVTLAEFLHHHVALLLREVAM